MIKRVAKAILAKTPYKVVKRDVYEYGDTSHGDAVTHNSLENMDRLFGDEKFLRGYLTRGRLKLHQRTKDLMIGAKPPAEVTTVADFGCGPADFFELLSPQYDHCTFYGYDFGNSTLAAAKQRYPAGVYEQYNLYDPPPRQHDVVICSQTLEHLTEPELAFRHLLQATKEGGIAIITVPDGRTDTYKGHVQFWSKESWAAWIARNAPRTHETSVIPSGTMGGANLAAIIWL